MDRRIDYLALEEGSSVSPEFDKERLKGYDEAKKLGTIDSSTIIAHVEHEMI